MRMQSARFALSERTTAIILSAVIFSLSMGGRTCNNFLACTGRIASEDLYLKWQCNKISKFQRTDKRSSTTPFILGTKKRLGKVFKVHLRTT